MILTVLRLKGGLGNQIFQIIYALSSSPEDQKIYVDCSHYLGAFESDYAGSELGVHKLLSEKTLKRTSFFKLTPFLSKLLWKFLDFFNLTNSSPKNKLRFLDGYFHEATYYNSQDNYLKYLNLQQNTFTEKINKSNVLIHVRKGDYTNAVNSQIYYNCDVDYFKRATDQMLKVIPNASFYVVSNDDAWVESHFTFLKDYKILKISDPVECFKVMCLFSNFVISNSTFGWWPAFLAKDAHVIAPELWFLDVNKNINVYPPSWNKV